jgi:hypothetical protein
LLVLNFKGFHASRKVTLTLTLTLIEISAPQIPTRSPAGNVDVLKNVRLSEIIVSDILDSGHLPIVFHMLNHIRTRNLSNPVDKFTDWEGFQSLVSELISPRSQINSRKDANKAARDFAISIASAYKLSTSKITL